MKNIFLGLVEDISELLGYARQDLQDFAPEAIRVEVQDVDFVIAHGRAPADLLSIYCHFGTVAEENLSEELTRLLEINLVLSSSCAGTLGFDALARQVIYVFHAPLRGLTAQELLQALLHAARQAHAWRNGDFTQFTPAIASDASSHVVVFA